MPLAALMPIADAEHCHTGVLEHARGRLRWRTAWRAPAASGGLAAGMQSCMSDVQMQRNVVHSSGTGAG